MRVDPFHNGPCRRQCLSGSGYQNRRYRDDPITSFEGEAFHVKGAGCCDEHRLAMRSELAAQRMASNDAAREAAKTTRDRTNQNKLQARLHDLASNPWTGPQSSAVAAQTANLAPDTQIGPQATRSTQGYGAAQTYGQQQPQQLPQSSNPVPDPYGLRGTIPIYQAYVQNRVPVNAFQTTTNTSQTPTRSQTLQTQSTATPNFGTGRAKTSSTASNPMAISSLLTARGTTPLPRGSTPMAQRGVSSKPLATRNTPTPAKSPEPSRVRRRPTNSPSESGQKTPTTSHPGTPDPELGNAPASGTARRGEETRVRKRPRKDPFGF